MGRTNPIALRLRGLMNWPSNIRHPLLVNYIKHIFQGHLIAEPGIRASTTGLWVNVTIFKPDSGKGLSPLDSHPKMKDPTLDFSKFTVKNALGKAEARIADISSSRFEKVYLHDLFKNVEKEEGLVRKKLGEGLLGEDETFSGISPLLVREREDGILQALRLYRDTNVHLQINVIRNPMLSADILSQYIAKQLSEDVPLPKIYKTMLNNLSSE